MSAVVGIILTAAVILGLVLRGRRIARQRNGWATESAQWEATAGRRGSERDHVAWELRQAKRLLAQTIAERDKAVLMLLTHADRQQRDQAAVIAVCLHRIAVLTARVADLEASRSVDEALAELLAADTGAAT